MQPTDDIAAVLREHAKAGMGHPAVATQGALVRVRCETDDVPWGVVLYLPTAEEAKRVATSISGGPYVELPLERL